MELQRVSVTCEYLGSWRLGPRAARGRGLGVGSRAWKNGVVCISKSLEEFVLHSALRGSVSYLSKGTPLHHILCGISSYKKR